MVFYKGVNSENEKIGEFVYDVSNGINIGLLNYIELRMKDFHRTLHVGYTVIKETKDKKIIYSVYSSDGGVSIETLFRGL